MLPAPLDHHLASLRHDPRPPASHAPRRLPRMLLPDHESALPTLSLRSPCGHRVPLPPLSPRVGAVGHLEADYRSPWATTPRPAPRRRGYPPGAGALPPPRRVEKDTGKKIFFTVDCGLIWCKCEGLNVKRQRQRCIPAIGSLIGWTKEFGDVDQLACRGTQGLHKGKLELRG